VYIQTNEQNDFNRHSTGMQKCLKAENQREPLYILCPKPVPVEDGNEKVPPCNTESPKTHHLSKITSLVLNAWMRKHHETSMRMISHCATSAASSLIINKGMFNVTYKIISY
jgi:hypothetical protein